MPATTPHAGVPPTRVPRASASPPPPPAQPAAQPGRPEAAQPAAAPRCRAGRTVLVAKALTNSDAGSGRVILPRLAVESNLPFVVGYRHYALSCRDDAGRVHALTIKSW